MKGPFGMCRIQWVGRLDRQLQQLLNGQRLATDTRGQRFAFEVLHHQEVDAVLLADVVEGADVPPQRTGPNGTGPSDRQSRGGRSREPASSAMSRPWARATDYRGGWLVGFDGRCGCAGRGLLGVPGEGCGL
jgi:hypothetical protein